MPGTAPHPPRDAADHGALMPEQRLVVLCARKDLLPGDESALLRTLLDGPLDWEAAASLARNPQVRPLLYRHLSRPPFAGAVSPPLLETLHAAYQDTLLRNLRNYGHLREILAAANQAGIRVALLKGAYLARFAYQDIGLRPMSDLDLLVPAGEGQALQLYKVPTTAGWTRAHALR